MADLLDSILGSMEKPPVIDAEKKKARGEFDRRVNFMVITVSNFNLTSSHSIAGISNIKRTQA